MEFTPSNITLTSTAQELCLNCHESLTKSHFINATISRFAALLLSPAAALDIAFHSIALPFSCLYAIGKSIYQKKVDFLLPWQHLQRIREAVFPFFCGSLFGVLHPYLGVYATESKTKHIVGGYLLSNSEKGVNVVISPVSAFAETISLIKNTPKNMQLSKECLHLTENILDWEKNLEKIQSFEMFDFKITHTVMGKLQDCIATSQMPTVLKEISVRIALIAYPILATLDLVFATSVSAFFLFTGIIQLIGGKSPAYLEITNSPVLHIYHLAKVIIGAVGLVVGFCVSFASPKLGSSFSYPSSKRFGIVSFLLRTQFVKLEKQIKSLKDQERLLLPVVIQNQQKTTSSELDIIPSNNSHMTYLLIEKKNDKFCAELIERGSDHGVKRNLTESEMIDIAKKCLSLRFSSMNENLTNFISSTFTEKDNLVDLGNQFIHNCVITNLFAAFDVVNHRTQGNKDVFQAKIQVFKLLVMKKYNYYKYDFSPFAPMHVIIDEIKKLQNTGI